MTMGVSSPDRAEDGGVAGIVPSRDFQWSFGVVPKRDERSQYEGPTTIPPSPVPQEAA